MLLLPVMETSRKQVSPERQKISRDQLLSPEIETLQSLQAFILVCSWRNNERGSDLLV
ncbi:MAG: hypothetical protein ACLU4J_03185 [Butyricimonas paravirosa]